MNKLIAGKKIVIAGGSGFMGQEFSNYFGEQNEIVILTRGLQNVKSNAFGNNIDFKANGLNVRNVEWDGITIAGWTKELDGADLLINLTGKTVNCRYTEKNKKEIFDSRINAVKVLGLALNQISHPPKLWINAGSATIYRHAIDKPQDEYTGEIQNDFSVQVCKLWEHTFYEQRTAFTRKVALRMAITLGIGGVMSPYFNLLKFKLGGHQGSGKQMYSWIHVMDTCRMIEWIYSHDNIEGTYNCCSPNPVTNSDFMRILRKVTGHIIGLPAYKWMLAIGTRLIGSEAELLLKSRWVVPTKILETGFTFQYPFLEDAFKEIIAKTPRKKYHFF